MLEAYNGDPELKEKFLAQLKWHKDEDAIVEMSYGHFDISDCEDGESGRWRGCAVACSLRSLDRIEGRPPKRKYDDHKELASRLGIPVELAYAEDVIFERLGVDVRAEWPQRFGAAIPVGADLSRIFPKLMCWLLAEPTSDLMEEEFTIFKEHFTALSEGRAHDASDLGPQLHQLFCGGNLHDVDWSDYIDADQRESVEQLFRLDVKAYITRDAQFVAIADKLIELIEAC